MKKRIIPLILLFSIFFVVVPIKIIASPQGVKPTIEATPIPEEDYIELSWEMGDYSQPYTFKIHQIREGEDSPQSIPSKSNVKVLNIYPDVSAEISFENWKGESFTLPKSASAKMWMEEPNEESLNGYGMGLIDVDVLSITDFNENPYLYLKDLSGEWKYDVIYFGAWDSNSSQDISDIALDSVEEFLKDSRGVLFGHDTAQQGAGSTFALSKVRDNFNKFHSYLNVENVPLEYEGMSYPELPVQYQVWGSDKVTIEKKGLLTNYPWNIGDVGTELEVPFTHTGWTISKGDKWLSFSDLNTSGWNRWTEDEENAYMSNPNHEMNWYLTTWNNAAMIQIGHSRGEATPDEQKILANTLFYLAQLTSETSWDDHSGQDVSAPEEVIVENVKINPMDETIEIEFTSVEDQGTTYGYYVEAIGSNDDISIYSDTIYTSITSGLKGYSIVVDENPNTRPDGIVDTTNTTYTVNTPLRNNFYIHIGAIDNAGNISVSHYHYNNETTSEIRIISSTTDWINDKIILDISVEDEFPVEAI